MDYEKKYKEALERARKGQSIKSIFPELNESKEERIKRELLEYLDERRVIERLTDTRVKDEWITWLEKQGGKDKLIKELGKYKVKYTQEVLSQQLEKQGEQKSANKVEPKFHNEEWITDGDYTWKIVEVKSLDYILQSQDGNIVDDTISYVDGQFHSFTIQDAKDGDVLSWDDSKCIALFKNIFNEDSFNSHGYVGHLTGVFESGFSYHSIKGAHPATKEQRDTLERTMTNAGYRWNKEKLKLEKI